MKITNHHPVLLFAFNVIAFIVYGIDKLKSKKGWWRIPEKTLLILAFMGGSLGARQAMQLFRHKTRHAEFRYGAPFGAFVSYCYSRLDRLPTGCGTADFVKFLFCCNDTFSCFYCA